VLVADGALDTKGLFCLVFWCSNRGARLVLQWSGDVRRGREAVGQGCNPPSAACSESEAGSQRNRIYRQGSIWKSAKNAKTSDITRQCAGWAASHGQWGYRVL